MDNEGVEGGYETTVIALVGGSILSGTLRATPGSDGTVGRDFRLAPNHILFPASAILERRDSNVSGTVSIAYRPGTIQGVVRDTQVVVTVSYTDSCGGTGTGVLGLHPDSVMTRAQWLKGTLSMSDQCKGTYAGVIALLKLDPFYR